MGRLLNQELEMRKAEPSAEAPAETLNRLPEAVILPANPPATALPQRHPFKRGVIFAVILGVPLLWHGWTHRPADPWTALLDDPPSLALLSPDITALAVVPPSAAPSPAGPPQVPMPFAQEHLILAAAVPQDLAIVVRTGRPAQPRPAVFPDDQALTQAADALRELKDALQASGRR